MDAVRDFFKRYNAVPASDSGIGWSAANLDALINWFNGECELLRRNDGDPKRKIFREIVTEMWARVEKLYKECAVRPPDWEGRNNIGRLLAALAANADLLTLTVK